MEQLDMFEMDMDKIDIFFRRYKITPVVGKRYITAAKECRLKEELTVGRVVIYGNLIRYDNMGLAFSDCWLIEASGAEHYSEFVVVALDDVDNFVTYNRNELEVGNAYRAEVYQMVGAEKTVVWMSCYYMGTTMSERVILVDFSNANRILMLKPEEIRGFYPLTLAEGKPAEEAEVQGEMVVLSAGLQLQEETEDQATQVMVAEDVF